MGLKDKLRRLEDRYEPEKCPECEKRITVIYPGKSYPDEPKSCPACEARLPGGAIIRVVYEGGERGA